MNLDGKLQSLLAARRELVAVCGGLVRVASMFVLARHDQEIERAVRELASWVSETLQGGVRRPEPREVKAWSRTRPQIRQAGHSH